MAGISAARKRCISRRRFTETCRTTAASRSRAFGIAASSTSRRKGPGWSHDYPDAEENFTKILRDVTAVRPFIEQGPMVGSVLVELSDSTLFRYPVSYMSEPGGWHATDKDIASLRAYLMKGGFMIFDDFREDFRTADFTNLRYEMGRALPGAKWVQLTGNEPIFDSFFKIDLKLAVNRTSSYGANPPTYWGIYQDNDPKKRLMMIANVDNDIGESWQYSATRLRADRRRRMRSTSWESIT